METGRDGDGGDGHDDGGGDRGQAGEGQQAGGNLHVDCWRCLRTDWRGDWWSICIKLNNLSS